MPPATQLFNTAFQIQKPDYCFVVSFLAFVFLSNVAFRCYFVCTIFISVKTTHKKAETEHVMFHELRLIVF